MHQNVGKSLQIKNFKAAYLRSGIKNYEVHQPYLKELADYYYRKYNTRLEIEPEGACWVDLFKVGIKNLACLNWKVRYCLEYGNINSYSNDYYYQSLLSLFALGLHTIQQRQS